MIGPGILWNAIATGLKKSPDAKIFDRSSILTFADISQQSNRLACSLAARLGTDEKQMVAIVRKNSPDYVVDLVGILQAGHLPILIDPQLAEPEKNSIFGHCHVRAVLTDRQSIEDFGLLTVDSTYDGSASRPIGDRTELCRLSSGSTRTPAAIEFTGAAVVAAATAWARTSGLTRRDVVLTLAGLFNGLAFNTSLIPSLLFGVDLALASGLPTGGSIISALDWCKPTVMVAFPAAFDSLARIFVSRGIKYGTVHTPRLLLSSAAPLSQDTAAEIRNRLAPINNYYGIAEAGPLTFNASPLQNNQGALLPGVAIKIDASGVIRVRSASMGSRYMNYPGEFEARVDGEGYYKTADCGTFENEVLTLGGRSDNSLIVGGRKIARAEILDAARTHNSVADCFVDVVISNGVELLALAVETQTSITKREIRDYLSARLAQHKLPTLIIVTRELPRGGAGKINKVAVRRMFVAEISP